MTEDLDNLSKDLYFQKVPTAWIAASYPSQLSLGAWLHDLGKRITSTKRWAQNGPPTVFNIATFYNPQSFFKATLRVVARVLKVQNKENQSLLHSTKPNCRRLRLADHAVTSIRCICTQLGTYMRLLCRIDNC